jgi:DNA repair photolyase
MSTPSKPGARTGRGAASNPSGRFESTRAEPVDDGWGSLDEALPPLPTVVRPEPARSIITRNKSPDLAFEQSINPYRGCEHGCVYCLTGDTRVLMAEGSEKPLADLQEGDEVYGTQKIGQYRRYVRTRVLAHWRTVKRACRIRLADGTELIASADHRFLTERGWKYVANSEGPDRRPHLTLDNTLMGFGTLARSSCPRNIESRVVKSAAKLEIVEITPLDGDRDLFDITTGTGDFIANGVVSHNCYARPSHAYLNLSPGLDFETKLFYKENAAELLERELAAPGYRCSPIAIGANTDPYQPIEREYRVTRGILEVLAKHRHPFSIITKSAMIERDIDVLAPLAHDLLVHAAISVTTLSNDLKRTLEPRTASPAGRLRAIRRLSEAGIPVTVMVAPVIPVLTDAELERILQAAAEAGARSAGYVLLRLPYELKDLFREWLEEHEPLKAKHVISRIHAMRGGRDNDPRWEHRFRGEGEYADLLARRFEAACRRFGLNQRDRQTTLRTDLFVAPRSAGPQLDLGL